MLQKRLRGPRKRGLQEAGRDWGRMELPVQAGARTPSSEDSGPRGSVAGMDPSSPRPDLPSPAAQTSCPGPLGASRVMEVPQLAVVHTVPAPCPLSAPKGFTQSPSWASRGSSCLLLGSWTSAWTLPAVSLLMSFGTPAPKAGS